MPASSRGLGWVLVLTSVHVGCGDASTVGSPPATVERPAVTGWNISRGGTADGAATAEVPAGTDPLRIVSPAAAISREMPNTPGRRTAASGVHTPRRYFKLSLVAHSGQTTIG